MTWWLHQFVNLFKEIKKLNFYLLPKYNLWKLLKTIEDLNMYFFYYYLLQVTKATSSVAMGPVAFKRCVDFILDVITTDRSPSIRKTMRVDYPRIQHEFDIWHVVKGMYSLLYKLLMLILSRITWMLFYFKCSFD